MHDLKAELLRGLWYVALMGDEVRAGQVVTSAVLGEPLLIGRHRDGGVFALRDICPHRGIPLHYGRFDGQIIACCYHGWRFDVSGTCVEIPSLREGQVMDLGKIRCGSYACVERQGLVWVYFPPADKAGTPSWVLQRLRRSPRSLPRYIRYSGPPRAGWRRSHRC